MRDILEKKQVKKKILTNRTKTQIRRDRDPLPWRYCVLTVICGVILVAGFFLAARSHFSSIDYGMRNSTLRKQIEELEAEKRRLIWARETAMSPAEIRRSMKRLGIGEMPTITMASFAPDRMSSSAPRQAANIPTAKPVKAVMATVDSKPVGRSSKDGSVKSTASVERADSREPSRVQIARR